MSRYVQRLGRVFEALQVLDMYPNGLLLGDLAEMLGCTSNDLRADLVALNAGHELGPGEADGFVEFLSRLPEPSDRDAEEEEPDDMFVEAAEAIAVRLHGTPLQRAAGGLTLSDVGAVLQAAEDLLRMDPGDTAAAGVVAHLRSRWLPGLSEVWRPSDEGRWEHELARAVREQRCVWIRYERYWRPGVVERVIEPYALLKTHRGFEVDAGPLDQEGRPRTYLVDQIRALEVREEGFEVPADVEGRCQEHRRTTSVVMVVPRDRQWTAEYLSEQVLVEHADDDVQLRLEVLEPVADRVGLVVLQAGADAFVTQPGELNDAAGSLAARLWTHHRLDERT